MNTMRNKNNKLTGLGWLFVAGAIGCIIWSLNWTLNGDFSEGITGYVMGNLGILVLATGLVLAGIGVSNHEGIQSSIEETPAEKKEMIHFCDGLCGVGFLMLLIGGGMAWWGGNAEIYPLEIYGIDLLVLAGGFMIIGAAVSQQTEKEYKEVLQANAKVRRFMQEQQRREQLNGNNTYNNAQINQGGYYNTDRQLDQRDYNSRQLNGYRRDEW